MHTGQNRSLLVSMMLVSGACSGGNANGGGETVCLEGEETGGLSGEDGCLFVPGCEAGEDEGPTEKLDLPDYPDLPCDPECPPPPNFEPPEDADLPGPWSHDSTTDTFYRLASETERAVHGWPEGTTLLSAGALVDGLINGRDAPMTLAVPIVMEKAGRRVIKLVYEKLVRRRSDHAVRHLSARVEAGELVSYAFNPEFHLFLPTWLDLDTLARGVWPRVDHFVLAYGDSHGGIVVQVMTRGEDLLISGPSTKLWLERPPPGERGVLVSRPVPREAALDDLLGHWRELGAEFCANTTCIWEPGPDEDDPSNCRDCVDNDGDAAVDSGDLACHHRNDFSCGNFGPHEHGREDVKDFAELPDIEWCTRMQEAGMPWHTELYAQASQAALLLNALPAAATLHPDYEPPADVPEIRYRFAYCVFADSVEAAEACVATGETCPPGYNLGGVTKQIESNSAASRDYFRRMWVEYDTAMHALEEEGLTPKPVALLSGVYSGNLFNAGEIPDLLIGLASGIGSLEAHIVTGGLGASTMEASYVEGPVIAHEIGHTLGLSHTLSDPHFGVNGFMRGGYPLASFAVLGPSKDPQEGYKGANQWSNWWLRIGDKQIPRPNAFGLDGCNDDDDCPLSLSCWNAGPTGFCRSF